MSKRVLVVCPNPAVDIYAWLDGFALGTPNRITTEKRYPGGKGLHVGMALAEMGLQVTIAGVWGGETGQWIKSACNLNYPEITFIGPIVNEWNRSCYTFKSNGAFDDTEILGTGPSLDSLDYTDLLCSIESTLPYTDMMALCGSWPTGSPENGYEEIIRLGKEHHVKSILDCTGVQLRNGLKAQPYGVHLNRKEITEFFHTDFETAQTEILKHCELAAITDGSKGLYLISSEARFHALAKVEKVISTIGSGDCLTAGVIAGLLKGWKPQQVANLGAACGAANCMREDLGMLYQKDINLLMTQFNNVTAES